MVNYCKNLAGLLGMFSLVIQKELQQENLSKEEYSSAVLHLVEQNAGNFRKTYCSCHCDQRLDCSLASGKRVAL